MFSLFAFAKRPAEVLICFSYYSVAKNTNYIKYTYRGESKSKWIHPQLLKDTVHLPQMTCLLLQIQSTIQRSLKMEPKTHLFHQVPDRIIRISNNLYLNKTRPQKKAPDFQNQRLKWNACIKIGNHWQFNTITKAITWVSPIKMTSTSI